MTSPHRFLSFLNRETLIKKQEFPCMKQISPFPCFYNTANKSTDNPTKESRLHPVLTHRKHKPFKSDSRVPVTRIPSLSFLVLAWVKIWEQKVFDCFWNLGFSWLSGIFSILAKSCGSLTGQSKTKHFLLAKNCLMHSLGQLDVWIWGPYPEEEEKQRVPWTYLMVFFFF